MNSVENEPHVKVLTQHLAGRLAAPGASAAAEVKVLMDSGSSITAMPEELVLALRRQPGMMQTALTQMFVGHARVVTSLGQECDIETQSCALHLTIDTPYGPVRFTMPFIVLPGGGDVVIIGQKTPREKLGIDIMAQLKASVLKAQGRQDGPEIELTTRSVVEPNDGAVLRPAMDITAFVPGGDAPGDMDDEVALTLPSHRPMIFKDSKVEIRDRVGVLETAVDDAVTMAPRWNVPRCCDISFLARTLTCCVGRCGVTHIHARSLRQYGISQGQGWCGRRPHLNVIACGGVPQSRAPTSAR